MKPIRPIIFLSILAILLLAAQAGYFLRIYTPQKIQSSKLESIKSREQLEDEYKFLISNIRETEASMSTVSIDKLSPDQKKLIRSQRAEITRLNNELNSLNSRLQKSLVKFERRENSEYSITLITEKDNVESLSQLQNLLKQKGFSVETLTFDQVDKNAFVYYADRAKEKAEYVAGIINNQISSAIRPEKKQKKEWEKRFQIKLKSIK